MRRWRTWLATALWLLALGATASPGAGSTPTAGPVSNEAAGTPTATATDEVLPPATVRYFNRDIVTFRARLFGNAPELRARAAEANIARIVDGNGIAAVSFQEQPQGVVILLSDQFVALVTPGDLDALHNQTLAQARAQVEQRLTEAVQRSESARNPRKLAASVLWVLLATLVACGLAWLVRRGFMGLHDRLDGWRALRMAKIKHESARHFATGVTAAGRGLVKVAGWLVLLLILEEWARFALGQFAFSQPWSQAMTGWLVDLLRSWAQSFVAAVPGLLTATLIILAARMVAQSVNFALRGVASGRYSLLGIDTMLAEPTRKLMVAVVWLFALAMAYPYLPGAQTPAFQGLSVFVGLMVSLGASSIVGQAAGGFTLLYSRTMALGDLVRIGDTEGQVQQIGLFTTRIRTPLGVEVSFPNNVVLGGQLKNYSRHPDGPGMWLETGVTIGYDAPWRQVHRLLLDAATRTAGVQAQPAPFVMQKELMDFYVAYSLHVHVIDLPGRMRVLSELRAHIQDAFNEAGVQIMSPNYEADPAQPKLAPRDAPEK
ncbi:MAG: mechanosensitive ion channel family protein [Arenimonas sp.]|nr:mechanosensitive ion channel family protein [Arenimonas sp.]